MLHRVLQGGGPKGRQLCFTFPSAPDPLFKASKAPFLTLRVATPSWAPRQAPLECYQIMPGLLGYDGLTIRHKNISSRKNLLELYFAYRYPI